MTIWHTDHGTRTGDEASILAQFGPSAFYRADSFLRPEAIGRIVTLRGERTVALVFATEPDEPTIMAARRKAGLDDGVDAVTCSDDDDDDSDDAVTTKETPT